MNEHKKGFETTAWMRELLGKYYADIQNCKKDGRPMAYVTAGFPVEILYAMDILPFYPENHAAMLGARRIAVELSQVAEAKGYSQDVCSYARSDLGFNFSGQSPVGPVPKPDFVLCCNQQCDTVTKWYEVLARYFDVPMFLIDTPNVQGMEPLDSALDYFQVQLRELVTFLEANTDRKLTDDKLEETVTYSSESTRLWREILWLGKNIPAPLTCFDAFINMGPIVTLRGLRECVDYYKKLKEEVEGRVAKGIGAVPNEKFRLYWDNIAIWFRLKALSEKFYAAGAAPVVATYTNGWAYQFDPGNPWESMARAYSKNFINCGMTWRLQNLMDLIDEFTIDGLIMHSNRSCKPYSLGQYTMKNIIMEKLKLPSLLVEGDMTDPRLFSAEQVEESIDTFLENLEKTASRDR
jgi:benzoyl-CoA reductase/2-hydroxyglutaryl-CoA dehydratase subunit BcrC/BadD/HgdB